MKCILLTAAMLAWIGDSALAQAPTCKIQAADKKLAGAALNSFTQRCQRNATAACDKPAADRRLAGAAKPSFTGKCVRDVVGN